MAETKDPRDTSIPGEDRMAGKSGPRDTSIPNEASDQERAKGSRSESVEGGGDSNRPIEEEQRDQQDLPPRGESQEGGHA